MTRKKTILQEPYLEHRRHTYDKKQVSLDGWSPTDFTDERQWMYVPSQNIYLRSDGLIFTEEDFERYDRLEKEWRDTIPNYSFSELLHIFPEARKIAKKHTKEKIKLLKEQTTMLVDWRERCNDTLNKIHKPDEREMYKDWFDSSFKDGYEKIETQIKKMQFHLSYIEELDGKKERINSKAVTENDIRKAKEVPITNFYTDRLSKHSKLATGRCPFHNEKTGSFTIYLEQNTFWCYGCGAGGTVIDFIMKQKNTTFLEAVKTLLSK